MRKHIVMLSALVAAFASFAAPFTDGGVTYTPNNEVSRYQPVVTGVNVTGMVESVAYTKGEVDRRIETNAPVRSVNGMRGNVRLGAREVGALPDNRAYLEDDANFVNAVRNVQVKSGDSERVLPPYLHEIEFDSTYPDDAKWYYEQADYSNAGMCSVRRTGNIVERNFDWKFDFMPEFVVRTVAAGGRFASIGVANIGDLLTEADVSKGWSPYYRCLPGHMTDGVNESGVFVEVNVVDGEPDWNNPGGDIHPLGAVRWVLDYGTNAQQAAEALASRIAFPAGWSQNFHYLVADEASTYIVENGAAHEVTGTAVMTNFKLYPDRDAEGSGQERYDLLASGEPITNAWWTLAYLRGTSPVRVSDIGTDTNAVFAAWGRGDRESHRGQVAGGQTWWQTVHTAVYDIGAKSLRICVQEKAEWYEFVLHTGGGGGGSVDPAQVEGIVAEYDRTNLTARIGAKADLYTEWVFSDKPELCRNPSVSHLTDGRWRFDCQLKFDELDNWNDYSFYSAVQDEPPLHFELVFNRHANRQKAVYSDGLNAKRDRTDNISHENSDAVHWEIVEHPMPEYSPLDPEPAYNGTEWQWRSTSPAVMPYSYIYAEGGPDATELEFHNPPYSFLIIRAVKRVTRAATEGRTFVTDDVIRGMVNKGDLATAISTNNPSFVSSVLETGLNIDTNDVAVIKAFVDDWPVDPATGATTLGGLLAALAAAIALLKKNKVDKETGKGLSTNDYTDADKAEVAKVKDKRDKDDLFVRCWSSQSGEVGLMKPISRDSSGNFRWSDGVHILVFDKSSGTTYPWQIAGGDLGDAAEGSVTDTTISFENIGLTLTESNLNIALSGLDDDGVPLDPNVEELFSESNTSTAANPDLNNKVLQASVNKLIDAKVGDVNAVLAAALDGTEVE